MYIVPKSCGCWRIDILKRGTFVAKSVTVKHGKCGTPLYGIWHSMKQRCFCETDNAYKWYGARGIGMVQEWVDDFSVFETWALSNGYDRGLSIDRMDNDGDYAPNNCRWATPVEQNRNRRGNRIITAGGLTLNIADWERYLGVKKNQLRNRLNADRRGYRRDQVSVVESFLKDRTS